MLRWIKSPTTDLNAKATFRFVDMSSVDSICHGLVSCRWTDIGVRPSSFASYRGTGLLEVYIRYSKLDDGIVRGTPKMGKIVYGSLYQGLESWGHLVLDLN